MNMCSLKYERIRKVQFHYLYPFTTENIAGYLPFFDLNNKSLLTVGSSSDQTLNAVYLGANMVDVIDICPFAKEYFYLKKAAIVSLKRDAFINFFSSRQGIFTRYNCFNMRTYQQLLEALEYYDAESAYFWSELFNHYSGITIRKNMFLPEEYRVKVIKAVNKYLQNDENYDDLRQKIDKTNVSFQLNDNGKMLITYLYDTDVLNEYSYSSSSIYNLVHTMAMFPGNVKCISIMGVLGISFNEKMYRDSVITYKKVKKRKV